MKTVLNGFPFSVKNVKGRYGTIKDISSVQLDFFKELENIGAGHAATALASMLGRPIGLNVPTAKLCDFNSVCDLLGGPESLVAGMLVGMTQDLKGSILFVLTMEDASDLTKAVITAMGIEETCTEDSLTEMQQSALMELANILCGSYINAISTLTGLVVSCTVPSLVIDMAGAIMNLPAAIYGEYGDSVLLLETVFSDETRLITGHFFLIPEVESHRILMQKMGIS
jgi:chemotaxis protein CheC